MTNLDTLKRNLSFETFLQEIHAENYHGTDDDMADAFENWLGEIGNDDLVQYTEQYGAGTIDRTALMVLDLVEKIGEEEISEGYLDFLSRLQAMKKEITTNN